MINTGLNISDIQKIQSVLNSYAEIEKAILFGSRAKGSYKPASDIDLTLVGQNLNLTIQQKIEGKLDDLLLPYKFDISIHHTISNAALLDHIERIGITLYHKEKANR
ncbi:nucleotidyltransferase domain-containing protein [Flavobacterium sp. 3HN19-14]|uniref:nucleotidyltransferase domain-containing protein n=1 Tax=Flavobacterium sp. 3HN19-14 TaxID=3448133 RepID=UPI003EDE8214